jgi:hypothetical protein
MGGDDSQKLLPWRGIRLLSGAQQTSGSQQHQHSSSNGHLLRRGCSSTTLLAWTHRVRLNHEFLSSNQRVRFGFGPCSITNNS